MMKGAPTNRVTLPTEIPWVSQLFISFHTPPNRVAWLAALPASKLKELPAFRTSERLALILATDSLQRLESITESLLLEILLGPVNVVLLTMKETKNKF